MSKRPPGRLKVRLAEMLNECMPGWTFSPWDIRVPEGYYRSSWQVGCYRWEARGASDGTCDGHGHKGAMNAYISSFSTITDCVRYGFVGGRESHWPPHDFTVERRVPEPQRVAS